MIKNEAYIENIKQFFYNTFLKKKILESTIYESENQRNIGGVPYGAVRSLESIPKEYLEKFKEGEDYTIKEEGKLHLVYASIPVRIYRISAPTMRGVGLCEQELREVVGDKTKLSVSIGVPYSILSEFRLNKDWQNSADFDGAKKWCKEWFLGYYKLMSHINSKKEISRRKHLKDEEAIFISSPFH